jgi:hypothetical protein
VTLAATVALEAARPRDVYHAVAAQPVRIGFILCSSGEPLCGTTAALELCPDDLFPPEVTCSRCAVIAAREGIAVAGTVPR